jgi:hypothetical protein
MSKCVGELGRHMAKSVFVCKGHVVLLGQRKLWRMLWAGSVAKMGSEINYCKTTGRHPNAMQPICRRSKFFHLSGTSLFQHVNSCLYSHNRNVVRHLRVRQ